MATDQLITLDGTAFGCRGSIPQSAHQFDVQQRRQAHSHHAGHFGCP